MLRKGPLAGVEDPALVGFLRGDRLAQLRSGGELRDRGVCGGHHLRLRVEHRGRRVQEFPVTLEHAEPIRLATQRRRGGHNFGGRQGQGIAAQGVVDHRGHRSLPRGWGVKDNVDQLSFHRSPHMRVSPSGTRVGHSLHRASRLSGNVVHLPHLRGTCG